MIAKLRSPTEVRRPSQIERGSTAGKAPTRRQRTRRIVGARRFGAHHARSRLQGGKRQGCPGQQAAAADGAEHPLQPGHVLGQFEGRRALAGDDAIIVVGRDECGPRARDDLRQHRLARGQRGFAGDDLGAIAGDRRALDRGRRGRHDDVGRDAAGSGGERERLRMVSGRVRGHAAGGLLRAQRQHGVRGAAHLEGADLLQVLALEEQVRAAQGVQRRAGDYGRPVHMPRDAGGSGADISQSRFHAGILSGRRERRRPRSVARAPVCGQRESAAYFASTSFRTDSAPPAVRRAK
jgi:hypothetical protein